MKSFTFENRNNPVYPAYLRIDDYCIYLEPELIQSLKEMTEIGDNKRFLSLIIDKMGSNSYLRKMIQHHIEKEANQSAFVLKLRNAINGLNPTKDRNPPLFEFHNSVLHLQK